MSPTPKPRKKRAKREPSVWVLERLEADGAWSPSHHTAHDTMTRAALIRVALTSLSGGLRVSEYRRISPRTAKTRRK